MTVTARVKLAELDHTWVAEVAPVNGSVAVSIPREAWLHEAAERYITDLWVVVDVGTRRGAARAACLAWPAGRDAAPVVWTEAQCIERAAQGVLDPVLRAPDLAPDARRMPDVGTSNEPPPVLRGEAVDR